MNRGKGYFQDVARSVYSYLIILLSYGRSSRLLFALGPILEILEPDIEGLVQKTWRQRF